MYTHIISRAYTHSPVIIHECPHGSWITSPQWHGHHTWWIPTPIPHLQLWTTVKKDIPWWYLARFVCSIFWWLWRTARRRLSLRGSCFCDRKFGHVRLSYVIRNIGYTCVVCGEINTVTKEDYFGDSRMPVLSLQSGTVSLNSTLAPYLCTGTAQVLRYWSQGTGNQAPCLCTVP